jgi:nucleotide-binding universal stress UspA family protein
MTDPLRFHTILVPMDFSPEAHKALELAGELAKSAGPAHLILLHAYFLPVEMEALAAEQNLPILELCSNEASKELEQILEGLQDAGISSEFIVSRGYPEQVIAELAQDKDVDLIVMGTRGRTGLAHVALGSIAERVVRDAPCPILTVKE